MGSKEKKAKYKDYEIFTFEDKYMTLGKKILDKDYKVVKILKDSKRNYVAVIEIENKKFVIKEPRNEYRIPQRKIMTIFKKGESLSTLENINKLVDKGFKEFIKPVLAVVKRENKMITYSLLVMEYFDGDIDISYNDKFVELVKKMHDHRVYHGDFNPGNFLVKNGEVKILDTQGKKMGLTNFRAHYDMITMKNDSYQEMEYPYKKNLIYYFAISLKKIKRLKIVEAIKKKKKELRDKGWKI